MRREAIAVWTLVPWIVAASLINWFTWGHDLTYEVSYWVNGMKTGSYSEPFADRARVFFIVAAGIFEGGLLAAITGLIARIGRPRAQQTRRPFVPTLIP
jgi:hypothetical protein